MSAPPFVPMGPPPLPPGWAEHMSPTGQPYYYNALTQQSTYVRPLPALPLASAFTIPPVQPAKKKEKPKVKTPIPGTEWLRVETTEGNVFYTHKVEKRSVWTIPDEIKDAVESLEQEEKQRAQHAAQSQEDVSMKEVERIKSEVQDMVGKRKADEVVPMDEVEVVSKKARVDEEDEEDDEDESDEEDWQREAAAQLAAEAEELKRLQEEERKRAEEEARAQAEADAAKRKQLNIPDRVDLSIDEAKALFKTLLREKDVNPLHPWDTSLPLFISDPRYVLLPSVSARKDAFDEYCRERARELRQSKVKSEKEPVDPKGEFEKLLREEVKSTRTSWTEWRRQWRKDRRFYGWGKDDREREKRFREYLKELGEKKRAAAQKAEADFFALIKESGIGKPGAVWKEVKRKIQDDPRYDAVGSSHLREELFGTYLKAQGSVITSSSTPPPAAPDTVAQNDVEDEAGRERKRKERAERAIKEREDKMRAERSKVDAEIDRSRQVVSKEEGELDFRTMLTDAVRDSQATWEGVLPQLKTDPRFTRSPLPFSQQRHLFQTHVAQLRAKHLTNLHALFASYSPSLSTKFTELPVSTLVASLPVTKLGFDIRQVELEYERWMRERNQEARRAFDEMLSENAFVEFWGRLGKIGGKGVDESIKGDDIGEDSEEGIVDMKALAKTVDLKEIVKVLRVRRILFEGIRTWNSSSVERQTISHFRSYTGTEGAVAACTLVFIFDNFRI
ncbi:hypothetical protein EIP86_004801 [Pleurotus ostreatoroseus]|nr:hypothetical protein EIP86_004801 [Pleurotus ostreatoroseus]